MYAIECFRAIIIEITKTFKKPLKNEAYRKAEQLYHAMEQEIELVDYLDCL